MKVAVSFFTLALALACWSASARGAEPEQLFGPKFRSTSVVRNGDPYDFVGHSRLHVTFFRHHRHEHVGWHSGCNGYGAEARVTAHRVVTTTIVSTLVGCGPAIERQEQFFARFFRADPRWSFHHHRLRLASDGTVIKLEKR